MTRLDELATPALLLDLDVLEANLDRMNRRAAELGVALRPHVKTHKCLEIGERQRARGAAGITVSTLHEARTFAAAGFDDLTWAFPLVLGRVAEAAELAARVRLGLVVDSHAAIGALEDAAGGPFVVWLKVDCGYHRAGVDPSSPLASELARRLADSPRLLFAGLLSHSGHAYKVSGRAALARVAEEERRVMTGLAAVLRRAGLAVPAVSVGSTPAMSAVERLDGVTEARPGNYVFHDGTQVALGACAPADCAVTVLTSVVSCQPGARHAVVDAGALALSKDPGVEGTALGAVLDAAGRPRPDLHLTVLSQEHGIVDGPLPLGERVRILPNHSCLTVACFDEYQVVRGARVVDRWRIWRGRDGTALPSAGLS